MGGVTPSLVVKYVVRKVGDLSWERPGCSIFNSYYIKVKGKGANQFLRFLHFTLDQYLIVLNVKQGGIKYHFFSLWYDSTWDWTPVFRLMGKHSNHFDKCPVLLFVVKDSYTLNHDCMRIIYEDRGQKKILVQQLHRKVNTKMQWT